MTNNKAMKMALPVMLHSEEEIKSFYVAKSRIEKSMQEKGIPSEVGVFNYMIPRFQIPDKRNAQLRNQEKYSLPIFHTELPIMDQYSLIHYGEEEELFGIRGGLVEAIEHAAKLIELSPTVPASDIDTHAGVFVYPGLTEDHPAPGSYSVKGFLQNRDKILEQVKERFEFLNAVAGKYGLRLTLENEPLANFEPAKVFGGRPALMYKPLSTPKALKYISNGVQTFDINHFGATKNVLKRMQLNGIDPKALFQVFDINSWGEYVEKFTDKSAYLSKNTIAVHVSNTKGIGVHLTNQEDIRKWGADGTNNGIIPREELLSIMNFANQRDIPSVIEVDYNFKKIDFKEADNFLEYIFG